MKSNLQLCTSLFSYETKMPRVGYLLAKSTSNIAAKLRYAILALLVVFFNLTLAQTTGSYGPVCNTASPIALTGTPSGGTWSCDTAGAIVGNTFDPSVFLTTGDKTITYTVGLNSADTVIHVDVPFTPTAGPDISGVCSGEVVGLTGGFSATDGSGAGSWSSSGTGTFSPSSTWVNVGNDYNSNVSESGTIVLTLTTNNGACPSSFSSLNLTIDATPVLTINPNTANICPGVTTLVPIPHTATGTTGGSTYDLIYDNFLVPTPPAGWVDVVGAPYTGGPLSINFPNTTPIGNYTFNLQVYNGSCASDIAGFYVGVLPVSNTTNNTFYATIQAAIDAATPGDVLQVCAGTFTENLIVNKALTIHGANFGVAGCGSRGVESTIAGGAGTAISITSSGVTIDGFEITGVTGVSSNGYSNIGIRNNKFNVAAVGINASAIATSSGSTYTIEDNCINLLNQVVAGPTTTIGILVNGATGTVGLVVDDNTTTNGFYGYLINGVSTTPVSIFSDGVITGCMQGIAVVNTIGGPLASSNISITGMNMSAFAGTQPTLPAQNFHAGIYTYTAGPTISANGITLAISNCTIDGTQTVTQASGGICINDFSTGTTSVQTVTINECNILNNLNRGIDVRGRVTASITNSTLTNNGGAAFGSGGNNGYALNVQQGANVTATNNFIVHPASSTTSVTAFFTGNTPSSLPNNIINASNNSVLMNGNTTNGVGANNTSGNTISATCNWWGSAIAANVTPLIVGAVTYQPYLTTGVDNSGAAGFQPVPNSCNGCMSGITNTNTSISFCTIQQAIDDAQTLNGHTITVAAGTYNEQVLVNKSVTIQGIGLPTVDFTGTPTGKLTLFDISADNVTIDGMRFNVDLSKLKSAIIASAIGLDNIIITNNTIDAYGTPLAGSYGDRNAVSVNYTGATNYRVATGGVNSITFTGNTVNGTAPSSYFRSGISTDESGGTFNSNTLQTINHDIIIRFASNGAITINNNNFNGGGVELADFNAAAGITTVSNNSFNATFANASAPGTAVLRLKNNYNSIVHNVTSNSFTNFDWAASLENTNSITFDGNTFAGLSATSHAVHFNTKSISSNSNTIVQVPVGGVFINNNFNGLGHAMTFANHDSDNDTYGTITIGTSGNENNFASTLASFIALDNQVGSSTGSVFPIYPGTGGWPTTMACWDQNNNIQNNKFDVGAGLQLPAAMNFAERSTLETKLYHKPDDSCLGLLIYVYPVHNLTQNTYYLTIQAGVNAANSGDVLELDEYTYNEAVTVTKSLTIQGINSNKANQVINGTGLGVVSGITISNGITNVTIKNVTIQNFTGASGNANAGIYAIGGNNNLTIDNVALLNNPTASGFYANGPVDAVSITNSMVTNNGPSARGIVIWNGMKSNITISNNMVTNNSCCGIELQDGNASGVIVSGNTIDIGGGDNAIGLLGLNASVGPNSINNNTITGGGRFGIEIKNPSGGVTVSNNNVSLTTVNADLRDRAGIAVYRRSVGPGNIDVPNGVTITNNTVSNYIQTLPDEGFGIVIEGTNNVVTNNTISNCNVGIQQQGGAHPNPNYPAGDGDQSAGNSANYFGRGNAPYACGNTIASNTFSGNTTDTRTVTANSYGLVTNTTSGEYFCNIQAGIDDAQTLNGNSLTVAAGTYPEDIIVDKSLTILGPNSAIDACAGTRVAEAIVVPATAAIASGEIFHVAASNVTISGFTIDGDNTSLTSGYSSTNGADIDAAEGITVYETGINNLTATNNIIQNLSYFGVTLYDYPAGVPSSGHVISNNKIQDLGTYDPASTIDYWGGGILLYNNQYAAITNNCMTNVRIGVQTGNFYQANPGLAASQVIDGNAIEARRTAIFHNLHYSSASALTLSNNAITALANANETRWDGIALSSLSVPSISTNNTINGNNITLSNLSKGYEIWNIKTPVTASTITGGSVAGVDIGVFANNYEGYSSDAPDGAHATVTNLTITPKANGTGIRIFDSPSSTTHANVRLAVTGCTISGGLEGIKFEETLAGVVGGTITNNTISAAAAGVNVNSMVTSVSNIFTLSNNAITLTAQIAGSNPTAGVLLRKLTGTTAATITNNTIGGAFFGYLGYNVNTTPVTQLVGGTITGVMQGASILNVDPLTGSAFAPSTIDMSNITMSGFTGNHVSLPNNNFHAGVYVFTGGTSNTDLVTSTLSNLNISGTGKITNDCAGMSFADFSTGAGNRQNITVTASTITNNLNRGINIRGANALVAINTSTVTDNGADPYGLGGNEGFGIIAREAAVVTIDNCFIANPVTVTAPYNVSAIAADAGSSPSVTVTASNNSILPNGNTTSRLLENSGGLFTATCNWFGSAVAATVAPYMYGAVTYQPYLTSGVDNSVAVGFQPVPNSCNACVSGVLNTNTSVTYCTIQSAIDAATAGDVLTVAAGTYAENVIVDKSLSILGPNAAIDACTGTRVAEAIVVPATDAVSSGEIFHVAASNVIISGFTIDGDNPLLPVNGYGFGGADMHAAEGVTVYETGINNLTVSNNIIKNLSYFGVTLYDYPAGVPSSGHVISNNKIHDLGTYDPASTIDYWGGGVLLYNNQYAAVTNNCMTNVRLGVQTGNFNQANPGLAASQVINGNSIQARRRGIFHNLAYTNASAYTLNNNTITGLSNANETAVWDGVLLSSMAVGSTASNNTINGAAIAVPTTYGASVWNCQTSPLVSGGIISNVQFGINVNNFEGYPTTGSNANNTSATIDGVTISSVSVAGIRVNDNALNTNNATVSAEVKNSTINASASATGILISGSDATANIHDNSATITGMLIGVDVDGGSAAIVTTKIDANGTGVRVKNNGALTSTLNNFITNNTGNGISIEASAGAIGPINSNDLSGNGTLDINNLSAQLLNATCNWYASNVPATVATRVSGSMTYIPYLSNGTDLGANPADGFQPAATCSAPCALVISATSTNVNCFSASDGTAAVTVTSGGISPYTYLWSTAAVTSSVTGLAPGTYTVTVTDINGCTNSTDVTITEPIQVTVTASSTNVSCNGLADGTITASGSAGSVITVDGNVLSNPYGPGTYTVVAKALDGNGVDSCSATTTVTITEPILVTVTASSTNVSCNGLADGTITISGVSAGATTIIQLSGVGADLSAQTTFAPGTYLITATAANGNNNGFCTATASVTITEPITVTVSASSTNVSCNGLADGTITISGVSAGATTMIQLNGVGADLSAQTTFAPGTYLITATAANGNNNGFCTATASVTITEPILVTVTASSTNVSCNGLADGTITASGSAGSTITVNGNPLVNPYGPGTYTVVATAPNGNNDGFCTATTTVTIIEFGAMVANVSISDSVSCNGVHDGELTANPTGGNGAYTYVWTNSSSVVVATTQTTPDTLGAGVYSVLITAPDGNNPPGGGICSVTATVNLINPDVLVIVLEDILDVQCYGYTTGTIDISMLGGTEPYAYNWSNGSTDQDVSNLAAGVYTVTVTDFHGCISTNIFEVEQNTQVLVGSSQTNVLCNSGFDGTATVTVSGGVGGYTYLWSNGQITQTAINLAAGNYTVKITDNSGNPGCDTIVSFLITEPTLLDATVNVVNLNCHGASNGTAEVFPTGGTPAYTYSWNTIPVQLTAVATGLTAGQYVCTIEDANGCEKDVVVNITSPDSLYFTQTVTNVTCPNGNDGSITASAQGGTAPYSYSWNTLPIQITETATGLTAGSYQLTVTDANNCQVISSVLVSEPAAFNIVIPTVNLLCNGNSNGTATATVTGGTAPYTYLWSTMPAQTLATATGLSAGTYSLAIVDASGCTSSATVDVLQPDAIALNEQIYNPVCIGNTGSIELSISGGTSPYTILWSNGNITQSNTGLTPGTYTVTVTDNNGCILSQSFDVVNPIAIAISSTVTNLTCNGNASGAITVSVSGGTAPYTYVWSNGGNTNTITMLAAGNYTVIVYDNFSCSATAVIAVTEPLALACVCNANVTNVSCFGGSNGSITAIPSGGTAPYSYSWIRIAPTVSGVLATTQTISGLTAGIYEVTITDANGCSIVGNATVSEPTLLTVFATTQSVACNGASTGTATAVAGGGVLPYSYNWNTSPAQTNASATGLGAGSYNVVVTDANGCTVSTTVVISQPSSLALTTNKTNVSCKKGNNGTATANVSGGTPPYLYNWSNGATTNYITGLVSGPYTVTVTDGNGCTETKSLFIGQPNALSTLFVSTNPSCFGSTNGSIDVIVTGGTAPYTYLWSTGVTTEDLIGTLAAGAYSVLITDANGCVKSATIYLVQPNAISLSTTQKNVSCNGGNDGKSTVNVTGGTAPYTYLWSDGQTTKTATGLFAGTYTITVTDSKGCSALISTTLTEPDLLVCSTTLIQSVSCNGGSDGKASVSATGGTASYSYIWNTVPVKTTVQVNNLTAGTYTVIVTDRKGCTSSCTVTVTQPDALTSVITSTNVSCNSGTNGTASVSVSGGVSPYTYLWNTGASATTSSISGLSAGTYTVTVTDANGCTQVTSVVITQPTAIVATATSTSVGCNGSSTGTVTTIASGGTGMLSYTLNPGAITNGTGIFTGLVAGPYTVTVSDANSCSITVNVTVNQATALSMTASTATDIACKFANTGTATAGSVSGGTLPYTYNWNSVPAQATATAIGLTSGAYTVVVTDANGCTVSNSVTINEPANALTVTVTNVINISCNGSNTGSAEAVASGGTGAATYLWSDGQNSAIATGLIAGTYVVTATDENGCNATATVVISSPNQFDVTATAVNATCFGNADGVINAVVTGGSAPYTYTVGIISNGTGVFTGLLAGTYTVSVTDFNGCTASTNVTIIEPAALIANATVTPVTCNGAINGSATVFVAGGTLPYSYLWSDGSTNVYPNTQQISGLAAGTYTVIVTDINGCTITRNVTVVQPNGLVLTPSQVDVKCYGGNSGTATATVSGGAAPYFYLWNNGQLTQTATGLIAGNYSVLVTDYNGCTTTGAYVIVQSDSVTANEIVAPVACFGDIGTITLAPTGGPATGTYTYSWLSEPGNSTNVGHYSSPAKMIYVTIFKDGCPYTKCIPVNTPTALAVATNNINPSCNGSANGSIAAGVSGGTAPYMYSWNTSPVQTDDMATGLSAGTYILTVTDANACVTTTTVTLADPALLSVAISNSNSSCGLDNGSALAVVSGGTTPYSYLWSPTFETTQSISNLPAGIYTVTVTDANGCMANASIEVGSNVPVSCATSQVNPTCAGYGNGSAMVTPSGGNGSYTYLWNTAPVQTTVSATGLAAGMYEVTVTDLTGCSSVCIVEIVEPTPLTYFTEQTNVNCFGTNSGNATITASGGTPSVINGYSYLWSNGQTTAMATGLVGGTYAFTVTDSLGCNVSSIVTLTQTTGISCNANSTPSTCGSANGTAIVNVFGGVAPYVYSWNTIPVQTNAIATLLTAGTYTVTVTDENGCQSQCTTIVHETSAMNFVLTGTPAPCANGNGTLSIFGFSGGTAPFTYLWSNGQTTASMSAIAGMYSVVVTDANGCSQSASSTITQPTAIVISSTTSNVTCNGYNNGSACVAVTGGIGNYSYLWNTGANISCVNSLISGTYTVTVTDANGCISSLQVVISQPATIDTISTSATAATCGNANGTGTVVLIGGTAPYSYAWATIPVQTLNTATGLAGGANNVNVTDANGCTKTILVDVPVVNGLTLGLNSPTYAGGVNIRCFGGSDGSINLTVGGTGPYTYNWSNGASTEDQIGLIAGTYTVTVSNGTCTAMASVTLTQANAAVSVATTQVNVTCMGGSTGSATAYGTGGITPYAYNWSNGSTAQTATGLMAGTYTVTVGDANGCTQTAQIVITAPVTGMVITSSSVNPTCYGNSNGSIDITVTGGTAPYSYLWTDGAVLEDRSGISAGSHTVTVTDANGCTVSLCVVLTSPPLLQVTMNKTNVSCSGGNGGSASAAPTGGVSPYTYLWSTGATTSVVSYLVSGTYTVSVTDANGCTVNGAVVIGQSTVMILNVVKTNVTVFGGNDGTATVSVVSGGTAPFSYSWNTVPVKTTAAVTGLTAGTYQVTVTDALGCVQNTSTVITQPNYFCNPITRPWRTESITTWAVAGNGSPSQSGQYLNNNFAAAFPGGLVVGGGACAGSKTLTLTNATAVRNFLSGQPNTVSNQLAATLVNPTSTTYKNKLAAQLVALNLNIRFDQYDPNFAPATTVQLASAIISGMTGGSAIFNGMTVEQFMGQANLRLASCTAAPVAAFGVWATAAETINLAYLGGTAVNSGLLSCPSGNNKVATSALPENWIVKAYPNPTSGIMNVAFVSYSNTDVNINLVDLTGRDVWNTKENVFEGENVRTYDFSALPKGIYMMRIELDGQVKIVRVVIN